MNGAPEQDLVRHVSIVDLSTDSPQKVEIEADASECAAIAGRLDILAVDALKAEIELFRDLTGDVNLVGRIQADVRQACVVTLDSVEQQIDTRIFQRFSGRDDDPEGDEEDPVEPIIENEIEIGDIVVQNLALALDPYPRAPGAAFQEVDDEAGKPAGPFAALAALRDNTEN